MAFGNMQTEFQVPEALKLTTCPTAHKFPLFMHILTGADENLLFK